MRNHLLVTINREFGSGGRIIGEELAHRMGVELVDSNILSEVAKIMNVKEGFLKKFDEKAPALWSGVNQAYGMFQGMSIPYYQESITNHELYIVQTRIIKQVAEKSSCVFMGRCANNILRNHPGCIRIFLKADLEWRMNNAIELYGFEAPKNLKKAILKKDKQRADYYRMYTQLKWRDFEQYDLVIDTSKLGIEGSVQVILNYVNQMDAKINKGRRIEI